MTEVATQVVQLGNKVDFSSGQLNDPSAVHNIQWQQNLSSKNADFILLAGNIDGTNDPVFTFVQASLKDKFQAKLQANGSISSFVVDKDFQYGQNKEKTFRFLVYQDKSNKEYQHRFLTVIGEANLAVTLAKYATKGSDLLSNILSQASYVSKISSQLQVLFGDPLRDF